MADDAPARSESPTPAEIQLEDELAAQGDAPAKSEDRSSLTQLLSKAIDITTVALPVTYNEPASFLQRMMEYLQYHDLLDRANACQDPHIRLLYVACFSVTLFAGTDRTVKPFNPLLGETFEYVNEANKLQFVSEQVSHHPPIGASHCENPNFIFYQTQSVKSRFLGNTLDITPSGVAHVILKKHNEHYAWPNIRTMVHNLILGRLWVDHYGDCAISCRDAVTDELLPRRAELKYKQCGWFGRGWHDVDGEVFGADNVSYFTFTGKWTESLSASATVAGNGARDDSAIPPLVLSVDKPVTIWTHTAPRSIDPKYSKHDWTDFFAKLCLLTDEIRKQIPLTDARLREDRYWLEHGDIKRASAAKHVLEEAQRARKRHSVASNTEFEPRYFQLLRTATGEVQKNMIGDDQWVTKGNYWKEREARMAKYAETGTLATNEDANKLWRSPKDW